MSSREYLRSRTAIPTEPTYNSSPSFKRGKYDYRTGTTSRGKSKDTGKKAMTLVAILGLVCLVGVGLYASSLLRGGKKEANVLVDTDVDGFEIALHHWESRKDQVIIYFVAGSSWMNPEDPNHSWCPDCNRVTPVFYQMMSKLGGYAIIKVDVGGPGDWKNPKHPLRLHEVYKLRSVPTLIKWREGQGVVSKIDRALESSRTKKDVQYYVKTFLETEPA